MGSKPMTGYPSIDKPWLKYYKPGAEEKATNIPAGKTVWDVIEEKLLQYKDIPAIEYFGRKISRPEFIDMVYTWARAFKALGVKEDEVIPYYGPFFPDVGAMADDILQKLEIKQQPGDNDAVENQDNLEENN